MILVFMNSYVALLNAGAIMFRSKFIDTNICSSVHICAFVHIFSYNNIPTSWRNFIQRAVFFHVGHLFLKIKLTFLLQCSLNLLLCLWIFHQPISLLDVYAIQIKILLSKKRPIKIYVVKFYVFIKNKYFNRNILYLIVS